jgi:hypothetical protein
MINDVLDGLRQVLEQELDRTQTPVGGLFGWRVNLFDATLDELGLDRLAVGCEQLLVRAGETACLTTAGGASALAPLVLQLEGIERVKALIGFPDELFERGWLAEPELPQRDWTLGAAFERSEICCEDLTDLQRAAYCYVYGPSTAVSPAYRAAIEHLYRPFELAVYAAGELVIEPGAQLAVTGKPAFLLFESMDIRQGGRLVVHVPFNITAHWLQCGAMSDRIYWTVGQPPRTAQR